ncbi:hypothetical protein ABKA04_006536 [Annulohypoxylon sp. FPYF3050]
MSPNVSADPVTTAAVVAAAGAELTYARIKAIGARNLQADDILLFYSAQTAPAHDVGAVAHGLANNSMTNV